MAAKASSFESAVLARIPGSTEHGPWLTCDGRLARVVETRLELVDPKSGAATIVLEQDTWWIALASGAPVIVRGRERGLEVCDFEGAVRAQLANVGRDSFGGPRPLAVSPDGTLVAGTEQGRLLWDTRTGACIASDDSGYSGEAAFSPDGRVIAFTHGAKPGTLVEVDGWKSHAIPGSGAKGTVRAPAFSPSGARVAFAPGRKLVLADVAARAPVAELKSTKAIFAIAWLDEDTIAIAARSSLVIRRVSDGAELATLPIRCTALAMDAAAKKLACAVDGVWVKGESELEIVVLDVRALLELLRAAPPTEPRTKKKPAKKRARPPNGCFFGVPASIPIERIESAANNLHYILDRRPEDFVLLVSPDEAVATLRWFTFVGSRGRHYLLAPWTESLVVDLGELTVALRSVAGTRFERFESGSISPSCALVCDGKEVRARVGEPAGGTDAIAAGLARFHPSEPADGYASALSGRAIRIRGDQDATKLVNMLDLIDAHRR